MLKETCSLFRHLILDDDVRMEFSKAHDHAKAIATEVLIDLTRLLPGECFSYIYRFILTLKLLFYSSSNERQDRFG